MDLKQIEEIYKSMLINMGLEDYLDEDEDEKKGDE